MNDIPLVIFQYIVFFIILFLVKTIYSWFISSELTFVYVHFLQCTDYIFLESALSNSYFYGYDGKLTKIPKRDFIFARVKTGQVGTWSPIE